MATLLVQPRAICSPDSLKTSMFKWNLCIAPSDYLWIPLHAGFSFESVHQAGWLHGLISQTMSTLEERVSHDFNFY